MVLAFSAAISPVVPCHPPMASSFEAPRHLVLVGGGHSHVEVLREWARAPAPGVRLSVVTDGPRAVYSGMVPGFLAGHYGLDEIEIDVERLARMAGAAWLNAQAMGLDAHSRRVHVHGASSL